MNILTIYNNQENENTNNTLIIKTILNTMPINEFYKLLTCIKEKKYLNNIPKIEIIFNHIIRNINKYKNNNIIKNLLFEILKEVLEYDKYNDFISSEKEENKNFDETKELLNNNILLENPYCNNKKKIKNKLNSNYNEKYFCKCLVELISILIEVNNNNILLVNNDIDYLNKLSLFLLKIKNEKLNIGIFKSFFYELYETESDNVENKLKYFDNNFNLGNYKLKKINLDLYQYLCKIVDFAMIFIPNKEIIIELLSYFEKIYKDYHINCDNKNSNYIICSFAHILNSQYIIPKFFIYLFNYAHNHNFNNKEKKKLNDYFNNYKNLVSFLFYYSTNPPYLINFKDCFNNEMNLSIYYEFLLEIIQIISDQKEGKNELNHKKDYFYNNSIELLKLFFLSTKTKKILFLNKQFENLFNKNYTFLRDNKILFSQYFITARNKNNNETYKKTILEMCVEMSISFSIELKTNTFNLFFIEDNNIKNLLFKNPDLKDKKYMNEDLDKFFKSQKYTKNEKPFLIQIINLLCEYIDKNKENNDTVNILNGYLQKYIGEIKDNYQNLKKFEKENEELRLINKEDEITEIINSLILYNQKRIAKEKKNLRDSIKESNNIENNDNDTCPLKKNCLLKIKQNEKTKSFKTKNNNDPTIDYGNYLDINSQNIILCLKRDLLLKECSIYFNDIYFNDRNFSEIKKYFKYNYENHKIIKLKNEIDKFKYPIKIKNYSNNEYAYPHMFVKPFTSFYNSNIFNISHSYFNRESIKKPSFPYFLPHYYYLKDIIEKCNETVVFNEECEAIMKTNIICGNICLNEKYLYFINNNETKNDCKNNIKYLFCSMIDDIKLKNKIIIIKLKDIQEIIIRRYIYDYRALEIFLKNGKSYYFNLYLKEKVKSFFEIIEKIRNNNAENDFKIINDPIKYFENNKYYEKWRNNEISTYQYLLYINKFASRSYNEINQYPIFPWIFLESKYGSHKAKGTVPKFRELAFPISIKNKEDKEDAIIFFEANLGENPSFPSHYRLHYSTSGYLLSYLVRLSPFTEEQIRFQNDQFDSPSRQINSIDEILNILSTSHDNRELIPEYFTTIEFMLNSNYIYFGYRLSDKVMINDIQCPKEFFNSISQYVYYNRLMLNVKIEYTEINESSFFKEELKINNWIDLIFGYKQWDEKPRKERLNLFGKYCYRQNINFDKILEKYNKKGLKEKDIIKKIDSKKARIINFGQCPEVLFKKPHKENILFSPPKEEKKEDEMEFMLNTKSAIDIHIYEKALNKTFIISSFWLTKNEDGDEYIYFLAFEDKNKNNDNSYRQYILIYKNVLQAKKEPDYTISINEIYLFNMKIKINKSNDKINDNDLLLGKSKTQQKVPYIKDKKELFNYSKSFKNERATSEMIKSDYILENDSNLKIMKRISDKHLTIIKDEEVNSKAKDYKSHIHYKISPKNCLIDFCFSNMIYFFIGRNIDNTIKIYEIEIDKGKKGQLKYNIQTDSFVSCIHKKDKNIFFTGHKNGKLYEWKINYNQDKSKVINSIKNIEIKRDLIAHKDSMICCITFIEKHNIIITSSNDGKIFIRKYFDFELLSAFKTERSNSIVLKIIYTDYDLLYMLINHREKESQNKSNINVYTLNGLLIEKSSNNYLIDIEPLKNGKVICNDINSSKLQIFGFNNKSGTFNEYDILQKMEIKKKKIVNFLFQPEKNCFFFLLEDKTLHKQQLPEFENIYKGVDKLKDIFVKENKDKDKDNSEKKKIVRFGSH